MRTFTAWLIANISKVTLIASVIMFEVLLFSVGFSALTEDKQVESVFFGPILMWLGMLALGGVPRRFVWDIIVLVWNIVILICALFLSIGQGAVCAFFAIIFGVAGCIAAVYAFIFTKENMEEVVAHRMFGWISRVDMFEMRWKYAFNRMVETLVCFDYLVCFCVCIGMLTK